MDSIKPTKQGFASIAVPHTKQTEYLVEGMPTVRVRVGATGKLGFSLRTRVNGKSTRVSMDVKELSKSGLMSAMLEAKNHAEIEADVGEVNLQSVGTAVIENTGLADGTKRNYRNSLRQLTEVMGTRLTDNTADILSAFNKITDQYGPVAANSAMKFYRRVLNYSGAAFNTKIEWPTGKVKTVKMWNEETPRSRKASHDEIPTIWEATEKMPDPWGRLLRFYMLTGFRNTEPLTGHIDGDDFIGQNKGKHFAIPVTPYMRELYGDGFVSPYTGKQVLNGRSITKYLKAETGLHYSPHDFRRLFGTVAEYAKVPQSTISQLYNHSTSASITQRYIGRNRLAMEAALLLIDETYTSLVAKPEDTPNFDNEEYLASVVERGRTRTAKVRVKKRSGLRPGMKVS